MVAIEYTYASGMTISSFLIPPYLPPAIPRGHHCFY